LNAIADTAAAMLDGSISYLLGARRIMDLGFKADLDRDPDFLPFIGVYSESDALPLDPEFRKRWQPEALLRLEPAIEAKERWAREFLRPYCVRLNERFGSSSN
jgi:hypothetical protein